MMRRYVMCEDGQHPNLQDEETLDFQLEKVSLALGVRKQLGTGTLFVTSRRLIWIKDDDPSCTDPNGEEQVAIDIDIPEVILHAITRDPDSYPTPCVYCQLNGSENFEDEEIEEEDDELFIVPSKDEELTAIFNALSHAAMMNPDPPEDGEEEGHDEFIYNYDEVALGAEQARILDHLESVFVAPTDAQLNDMQENDNEDDDDDTNGQFDDA
mmetsp:Transcript_4115/g.6177  ORF Transcript_4115/g.6177 Transcript_4115/m.6177 type:complete len:212 (+) Transcript_4115:150-785(+)